MSPQFRATTKNTTSKIANGDGPSCNPCSVAMSVAELAKAADMSFALHKIESESSAEGWTPANPLLTQDSSCQPHASSARKRSCTQISSEDPTQPFLSSYGSAFLSGIFADIAQASDETGASNSHSGEPHHKKSRTMPAPLTFGRQSKSFQALAGLTDGADSEVVMPSVVSPRSNKSTENFHHFKDPVQELQGMAFPSLPTIPNTVSSSSFSSSNLTAATSLTREESQCSLASESMDQDSPSEYGWFVSTDDDAESALVKERAMSVSIAPAFDDLAFKARSASVAEEAPQDTEVQQALAADTIDDVLGDFF